MNRVVLGLVALAALACASCAVDGAGSSDEVGDKAAPVLGATCRSDSGCAAAEYCARPTCVRAPCPSTGHCEVRYDFEDSPGAAIPDNSSRGVSRKFTVVNPGKTVASVRAVVQITHQYRGDLRVVLRSPSGTEAVLHDRTGGGARDLSIDVPVSTFNGESAHGDWTLTVTDRAATDTGSLARWRLVFTYGDPAESTEGVWATVTVDSIASAHPYAADEDRSWNLAPWTGGASSVRVHFTRIETEANYDFVELVDGEGNVLASYSGTKSAFTTEAFDTNDISVRLRSDYDIQKYGFEIDTIEVYGAGCLADDDCGDGQYCPVSRVCVRYPCFQTCEPVATGGGEGDECDTSGDCGESLYCRDGSCRGDGSCGSASDCSEYGNTWYHASCDGSARCTGSLCAWDCGRPKSRIGEACDITSDCVPGLFCSSDSTCHAMGTCDDASDCNRDDNTYSRPTCTTGSPVGVCGSRGVCSASCPPPAECRAGETQTRDCNTCSCDSGRWRCTTRPCPRAARLGEACGGSDRIACETDLVCDRGRRSTGTCSSTTRSGICVATPDADRSCSGFSPVCGCNGQTFENDCLREGLADFSKSGRCELALSIPDNSASGITQTLDVRSAGSSSTAQIEVEIQHPYRADLIVTVTAPSGRRFTLQNRGGGSAANFTFDSEVDLGSSAVAGTWTLFVSDNAASDRGTLKFFNVTPR